MTFTYTVLTLDTRKDFDTHSKAFAYYSALKTRPCGVFKIIGKGGAGGVNVSADILEEYEILSNHNLKRHVI
jgi:hypothetical protein